MPDNAASGLWRIAGVDMSAQPEKTALAYFEFGPGDRIVLHQEPGPPRRKAEGKTKRVDNARLVDLFREPHTVVGIDAPLGWPRTS